MHGCGQLTRQMSSAWLRTVGLWSTLLLCTSKADSSSRPYSKRPLSVLSVCFRLCHGTLPSCSIKDAMKMILQHTHCKICQAATGRMCSNIWLQRQTWTRLEGALSFNLSMSKWKSRKWPQ